MLRLTQDYSSDSPIHNVITVNECMAMFHIKNRSTVHMAIFKGKLDARKCDSDIGQARGFYLIDFRSAYELWGDRA